MLVCYIVTCTFISNIHLISYVHATIPRECGQTQKTLKVKICTYFSDLGLPKICRGGEFCCNNYHSVLCACLRKKQQLDRCLRPGQRTANATVLQSMLLAGILSFRCHMDRQQPGRCPREPTASCTSLKRHSVFF